jgi:hypothetical protein
MKLSTLRRRLDELAERHDDEEIHVSLEQRTSTGTVQIAFRVASGATAHEDWDRPVALLMKSGWVDAT